MEYSKKIQQITQQFKCPLCGAIASYSGLPGEHLTIKCNACGAKGNAVFPQQIVIPHDGAIEISHLTKVFGKFTAVNDVSFSVKKGEIFGLLGPNGAGKSTIIRMLCTLSKPTQGFATVAGYDVVRQDNKVREHIGLVSEKLIMYDQLTARENLTLFGRLYNIPDAVLDQRIEELLRFVRMEKWADQRIDTFSTGMKQRINVIRALVNQPEILFLDEPTLGLDPQSTVEIRELTKRINAEHGTTIILTTHIMVEADILCNRIGIVDHGKIVALDTPVNLKKLVSGTDGSGFELEIPNLQERMLTSLQALKSVRSVVQEKPTQVIIRAQGSESFDEIIDTLRNHGAKILMIKNLEPTLEDVFLHLTGREARQTVSDNGTNKPGFGPHGRRKRQAKRSR